MLNVAFIYLILCTQFKGTQYYGYNKDRTQDQTTSRANTLSDDADDLQKQLDNEARDRQIFGQHKIVWVCHLSPKSYEDTHKSSKINPRVLERQDSKVSNLKENNFQDKWHYMFPSCAGKSQSPVDLPTKGLVKVHGHGPLVFANYDEKPVAMNVIFDGTRVTLYGKWKKGRKPSITGGAAHNRRYFFHSLTMHTPSEHTVEGVAFPLELQMMHVSTEYPTINDALDSHDRLALLGISSIFEYDNNTNPWMKALVEAAIDSRIHNENIPIKPTPMSDISPPFTQYAVYHGSLSIPPCVESVLWIVRSKTLPIEKELLEKMNNENKAHGLVNLLSRHTQPLNDRKVYWFGY